MAKKLLSNGWVRLATLAITITVLTVAGVKGYTVLRERQMVGGEARQTLKAEGCMPARRNTTDIAVINSQLKVIVSNQEMQRRETKESFREVMAALKK